MTIINLTQHKATQDQKDAGVVDLPDKLRDQLVELLTFDDLPDSHEVINRANKIAWMIDHFVKSKPTAAMIGGAPFLMPVLDKALRNYGHTPLYAFSKRESVEKTNPDGTVVKTSVFKHAGFVELGEPSCW